MSTKFSFESFADKYLIHENLHKNVEDLGKARFVVYTMIVSSVFVTLYTIGLEISGKELTLLKKICNLLGTFLGVLSVIVVRFSGNLKLAIFLNLILGACFVIVSSFYSGGIFTVDSFWFIVLAMVSFMFINRTTGIILICFSIVVYSVYFYLHKIGYRDFRQDNVKLGLDYEYYNLIFLLFFASLLTYFYVNGTEKIKKELQELKDKQVKDLDNKYKYITENAVEIIALHNDQGETTYVSQAIQKTLGYEPKEVLGKKYMELINFDPFVNASSKLHFCKTKDDRLVWLEITTSRIKEELGSGNVIISMARDVTEKVLENQKINELREQIANDFHDEMGNKLASITLNSNILSIQSENNPEMAKILEKIEETSKSLYQNSRDFIWSIDAKSDRLDEIFSYLRDFGEDFFQSLPMNFLSATNDFKALQNIQLPMYSGRHIILIFKEAFTNAGKYSESDNVKLDLISDGNNFEISFQDDGKGFDIEKAKLGKGLNSMKKRAGLIEQDLLISSSKNGTKISLKGKLPKLGETANPFNQ